MNTTSIPEILTHTDAGVMTLTINRVDKKNSITAAMYAAMADALAAAVDRKSTRLNSSHRNTSRMPSSA